MTWIEAEYKGINISRDKCDARVHIGIYLGEVDGVTRTERKYYPAVTNAKSAIRYYFKLGYTAHRGLLRQF